jgi:hypothetical protein
MEELIIKQEFDNVQLENGEFSLRIYNFKINGENDFIIAKKILHGRRVDKIAQKNN